MAGKTLFGGALALLLLSSAGTLNAAPELTQIQDILYKADGTRYDGIVFIEWRTFDSSGGTPVPQNNVAVKVTYGLLKVKLVPSTTAIPAAYYRVRYSNNGAQQFVEYWGVPPSATTLKLRDVRLAGPPVGGVPFPPPGNSTTIPDITGLREELDARPAKGATFVASRAAVINSNGEVESALGGASDCIRVDGSSGPCGGSSMVFADAETPAGIVDGSNATFTIANPPSPVASLQIFRNGLLLKSGSDYNLVGSTLTFVSVAIPQSGDTLLAYYRR
jgi:hypothetical protein